MSENGSPTRKRAWADSSESETESSVGLKRVREDLLDLLDDADFSGAGERYPTVQDLATVMKLFEEEISPPSLSGSGGDLPDLDYLLEASDDELGIPPPTASPSAVEEERVHVNLLSEEVAGMGELWRFEDDIPSYDVLEIGISQVESAEESVVFEGLFDSGDFGFSDSDLPWRHK